MSERPFTFKTLGEREALPSIDGYEKGRAAFGGPPRFQDTSWVYG
jgi:hypothetical protein